MKKQISSSSVSAIRAILGLLLALLAGGSGLTAADNVYGKVMQECLRHPNRRPGSEGYNAVLRTLEEQLRHGGLQPERQTFKAYAPVTRECRLVVDGRVVKGVLPLAPNAFAPATTFGGTIKGKLVYLGQGTLEEMKGKAVKGNIAVLDFSSPNMMTVFAQGAAAVLFVDDGKADQWQSGKGHFSQLPMPQPRAYISAAAARESGIDRLWAPEPAPKPAAASPAAEKKDAPAAAKAPAAAAQNKQETPAAVPARPEVNSPKNAVKAFAAELTIRCEVLPQTGVNLWAVIPGKPGKTFSLEKEEAIVLAADFATSGVVPDFCPDMRLAANAALLAQVACDMAAQKPERTVYIVFFGGHWNAEEGARNFYYALSNASRTNNRDMLEKRREWIEAEIETISRYRQWFVSPEKLLAACIRTDNSGDRNAEFDVNALSILENKLVGITNNFNFEIQEITQKKFAGQGSEKARKREDECRVEKRKWNNVRRLVGSLRQGKMPKEREGVDNAEVMKYFAELLVRVEQDLETRLHIMNGELADNLSAQKLSDSACYWLPYSGPDAAAETPEEKRERRRAREIVGHYAFDFANAETPWMFLMSGEQRLLNSLSAVNLGSFRRHLTTLGAVYEKCKGDDWSAPLQTGVLTCPVAPAFFCYPAERSLNCSAAQGVKVYGYNLVTVGDRLNQDDMPVAQAVDLSRLRWGLNSFCAALAADDSLSLSSQLARSGFYKDACYQMSGTTLRGKKVNFQAKGSTEIEGPAVGAMAVVFGSGGLMSPAIAGHNRMALGEVNSMGGVYIPNVVQGGDTRFLGASFDTNGNLTHISNCADTSKDGRLFYAYGGGLNFPLNPASYLFTYSPTILRAANDSAFKQAVVLNGSGAMAFYHDRPDNFKFIGNGVLLLGGVKQKPTGFGLSQKADDLLAVDTVARSAYDYNMLNLDAEGKDKDGSRLKELQKRNIVNNSLWELQTDAKDHLESASEERKKGNVALAAAHETFAMILGYRAYQPLKDTNNDIVSAVVVLMLLSIPFAFVMERLICGYPVIYKQIAAFIVFFLVTLGLLRLCHPAFSVAESPEVIFLAFAIILMSALVIFIVMGKFRHEIKAMQGLASKAHSAGAESSTALASILIGISGMRNRPLKTILTAATIILLTFTILVFSSFTSQLGVVPTYMGAGSGESRIELHLPSFFNLPEKLLNSMEKIIGDNYVYCRRAARFVDPFDSRVYGSMEKQTIVYSPTNGKWVILECLMGLERNEFLNNQELREKVVPSFLDVTARAEKVPPLFLSAVVAEKLGVKPGDELRVCGSVFRYAGEFDPLAMQNFSNIDGTRIMAPNFSATMKENQVEGNNQQLEMAFANIDVSSFTWAQPSACAVTTYAAMADLRAAANFMTVYPKAGADVNIADAASELSRVFNSPVFAKDREGARQFFFTRSFSGAGFGDIIVPLILGGLIIFSSLLGSIVDREKEIFTYSALGLAPKDVAALFFAESSVYAIVGGVGGYLFSQLVAKILSLLASLNIFNPPEMNFSSLSSMYTILLVMAVVMLSTIYPALKAGRSANSGVNRKWKMPEPNGDDINFVFPFTVSAVDMTGILSYIKEFFDSHATASLGSFAARNVRISGTPGNYNDLSLAADLSLAPFDLGIFQDFRMSSQPSDIEGIQEVVISIRRRSGSPGSWLRSNRNFVGDLRNQFLIWRSLPLETMVYYRQQTEETLKNQK